MMFGCPCTYTTQSMPCQTKGVSICPHSFGCPHMLGCTPICLNVPICLDGSLYVWMPPYVWTSLYVWMPPISLETPMFGCPPLCLDTPMFVPPTCLDAPICLGAPYVCTPLCMVGCPHMFGHPLYVWMLSICLAPPVCLDTPEMYGGIQRYEGHPNIWVVCKYRGYPTIQGHTKHMGASKCIEGILTPPQSDKACFLCVVYVQWASKHLLNIQGGIQTYGCPNI